MHPAFPVPLRPSIQRWRSWWPLLARSLIPARRAVEVRPLRAARLLQFRSRSSKQPVPCPARQAEAGPRRGILQEV